MDQLNLAAESLQLDDGLLAPNSPQSSSESVYHPDDVSYMDWYSHPEFGHPHNLAPATRSCFECVVLSIELLVYLSKNPDAGGYSFNMTYREQQRSAERCALCRAICLAVTMTAQDLARDTGRDADEFVLPDTRLALVVRPSQTNLLDTIVVTDAANADDDRDSSDRSDLSVGAYVGPRCRGLLKCGDVADPMKNFDPSGIYTLEEKDDPPASYRSPLFARTLASWIDKCNTEHPKCHAYRSRRFTRYVGLSKLPPRLISLEENQGRLELSLCETEGQFGTYCALSHCWGGRDILKTTRENIGSFMVEIPFNLLPQTFIDAVKIAHHTGLRYVWIDSLCILQDDADDWNYNSTRMDEIYSGAYFTIAASAASSSGGGCLPVQVFSSHSVRIPLSAEDLVQKNGRAATFMPANGQSLCWDFYYEPLQKRGWTLQERLLSQRVLYCSRYQYIWLCRESQVEESLDNADSFFDLGTSEDDSENRVLLLPADYSASQKALGDWYRILKDYSNRKLTLDTDKLPAIAGLAKTFQETIEGTYIYGHWAADLPASLLWRHDNHWYNELDDLLEFRSVKPFNLGRSRSRRSCPQRAPSWSWASVDGYISYGGYDALYEWRKDLGLLGTRRILHFYPLWHVDFASDDDHDKFAATKFSRPSLLRVVGQLFEAIPRLEFDSYDESSSVGSEPYEKAGDLKWELVGAPKEKMAHYMDDPSFSMEDVQPDQNFYMLPITILQWLILTDTSQQRLYRRIGMVERHMHLYEEPESDRDGDEDNDEDKDQDAWEDEYNDTGSGSDFGSHETGDDISEIILDLDQELSDESVHSSEAPAALPQIPAPPLLDREFLTSDGNSSRSRKSSDASVVEKRRKIAESWARVAELGSIQNFFLS